MMKCKNQPALACPIGIGNIEASACLMAVCSGFYESHETPPSGNARGIVPPHPDEHRMASKEGTFCIVVLLIVAMVAAGAIRSDPLPDGSVQWLPM